MKKQTKCYIYTRVSTSIQVDGYSLEAQKDKLRKYADYQDYVVAGEYSDEGFSGKNIQGRLEFQRMLRDIQEGKDQVEYVLVFKLSRFGRNAADVLNSLQLMQDFGVNLICVEDGIDSSKDAGKLMISVLSAVAEIEARMEELDNQIQSIRQEQISSENVYRLLSVFDELYADLEPTEKRDLMRAIIERIDLYPEQREDGCWVRNIVFNFPVPVNGVLLKELPLENATMLETVVMLSRGRG